MTGRTLCAATTPARCAAIPAPQMNACTPRSGAASTYATVSLLFWFVGLIPDLAALRDRAQNPGVKKIYGMRHGVNGLVHEPPAVVDLTRYPAAKLAGVARTPAAALGSSRDKP